MDINDLISGEIFNSKNLKPIATATETDAKDVKTVLTSAIPILLQGMVQNSQTADGAKSLEKALAEHSAEKPASSLTTYLKSADPKDGAKIVKHVLGEDATDITKGLAKQTKVSGAKIKKILAYIAPLLLSLLGNQTSGSSSNGLSSVISNLLGGSSLNNSSIGLGTIASLLLGNQTNSSTNNTDLTSVLLGSLLGGSSSNSSNNNDLAGNLLGSLLGGSSNNNNNNDLAGSLLGSLLGGSSSGSNNNSGSLLGSLLGGSSSGGGNALSLVTSLLTGK